MLKPILGALAALAVAAPAASAHHGSSPDAQIFATNNTRVITDPADPQLHDPLNGFARRVQRIIERGGGTPAGSQLLDGVFFDSDQGTTTFERSREFDVDRVSDDELHAIADKVRSRFHQGSVLTFDVLRPADDTVDAVELDVPGVSARALRDGLLADQTARERLFGGSVTQDDHLLLVAGLEDAQLARAFAQSIGGDVPRAVTRYGRDEFVDGPAPVRVEHRTLVVDSGPHDETIALAPQRRRLAVDIGETRFEIARGRFDRIRVDGGDGLDTLAFAGSPAAERYAVSAAGGQVRLTRDLGDLRLNLDGVEKLRVAAQGGSDAITVGDLSATDMFEVDPDLGAGDADAATVEASDDADQVSVSNFAGAVAVLGPTFVRLENAEAADRLTVDGRGGDDILSASTDAVALTLSGGDGTDTVIGGPGDDVLIGGRGFDDVSGGKGNDAAALGADGDRFNWRPGDGSDDVDGGPGLDSLSFFGTNDAEAFGLQPDGHGLRFTRDVDAVGLDLQRLEEVDTLAGAGADTFAIGDLSRTGAALVDISVAPGLGVPGGDGQADRITVEGTDGRDELTLVGKVTVAGTATLTGLPATVNVSHAEGALDTLAIDTRAGEDSVDTSGLAPGTIGVEVRD